MTTLLIIFGVYLAVGLVALVLFDLKTKRVRRNLFDASLQVQSRVVTQQVFLGLRSAKIVTLLATWLFWVVVFYGYIESRWKEKNADKI